MTTLFDRLYGATEEFIKTSKKPFVSKKIRRGFEASICSLEEQKIDLEEKKTKLMSQLAVGEVDKIKEIAKYSVDLREIDAMINSILAVQDELFGEDKPLKPVK